MHMYYLMLQHCELIQVKRLIKCKARIYHFDTYLLHSFAADGACATHKPTIGTATFDPSVLYPTEKGIGNFLII